MIECDVCQDFGYKCKEYPFKTRVMRFDDEFAGMSVITKVLINSPIESCQVRPLWIEFNEKMKALQK